ncbi:MAG: class I SAM-dependent methyltransferase [Actinobacteria bacterium]|nr:class I SAM-dependent methyltransferase [Actinomycetota bacterium]
MSPIDENVSDAPDTEAIDTFKQVQHVIWATGDFPDVAERNIWDVGARIVRHLGVRQGEDVLDVACGSGNAALRAAKAGASVVGVDLTPELFDRARQLADEAGVWMELIEGDAEDLPFDEETFDVVVSTFGHMFAPRHGVAAGEIARVLRPGGRIGLTTWTPEGEIGRFFATLADYMPVPPPFAESPVLWGSEQHVLEMFSESGIELSFKRETIKPPPFETPEHALEYWSTKFGPLALARAATEGAGTWSELRVKLLEYYADQEPLEYLVILGRKAG